MKHPLRTLLLACALALTGCAADRLHKEGLQLIESGRIEEGLAKMEDATREDPKDYKLRTSLVTTRERVVGRMLLGADRAMSMGNVRDAEDIYRRVLAIEDRNDRARRGLEAVEKSKSAEDAIKAGQTAAGKGDLDSAERQLAIALSLNPRHPQLPALRNQIDERRIKEAGAYPVLKSKLTKPVSLEFRDANLKMVFDVLARTASLNFIFDKDVKPDIKATIFVKQVSVEDAIDLLLVQNQLEKKVINDSTLLIYPVSPQKQKDYQDLVVKSFYLGNADVKQTLNLIKTILKTKDVFIDEKLNLLVMRDTPDAVKIAEKLISAQDLAEPEVVLEIEVLEINRNKLLDLGVQWPSQLSQPTTERRENTGDGPDNPPIFDPIPQTLKAFTNNFRIREFIVDRNLVIKLANTDSDSRQLASPRIRVKSKEKAKIHIGDRVPVVTATVSAASGSNPIVTDTIQYLDVGIKLDVEPVVQGNDEVAIKLALDVSSATQLAATRNGSIPVQVSTRSASTVLRLKDGETQALAGLIQSSTSESKDSLPFLGDLPVLGRVFGTNRNDNRNTELVLLVTPRIVRSLPPVSASITEMVSGTEGALRSRPLNIRPVEAEATALRGTGTPAVTPPAPRTPAAPAAQPAQATAPAAAAAAPAAAPPSGGVTLSLVGGGEAKVGQEFTITLQASAEQPLMSTALQVGFDAAALKVIDVTEGDWLKSDGAQTTFTQRVDAASGKVFIGISRTGGTGIAGEGGIVNIKFAGQAEKASAPVSVVVFSGVGQGNRLLPSTLPRPLDVKVSP